MRSAPRSFMGGGLFLGCENTAGGGSSSRSSSGSSSGGSTTPLQVPPTADMIDDLFDSSKGGLTNQNDKQNIEDFLKALSGPAKVALERNGWTSKSGEAGALKNLADTYANLPASQKGTTDDPVKLLNDLASNNNGKDNGNKSSDLDGFLKDTANKSGGKIDTSGTLSDLQNAKGKQDEVLKALGNGNENNGKGKSEQLNALNPAVTAADLAPIVSGITNQDNKNKLADVANDLIADLVKDTTKHPTGTNDLKTYLDDNSNTAADLNKYKEEIKNSYPITSGQTIKQFIDSLADIYKKLGNGDEAAGKAIYNKLIAGGVTADKIKALVTAVDPNAGKIKDIDTALVKNLVEKTSTNPTGTNALKAYLDAGETTADLNTYKDKIEKLYPMKAGQTLADFIADMKSGAADATGGSSRVIQGTAETGDAIDGSGKLIKSDKIKDNAGNIIGYIYKVDPATKTAYAVGTPSPTTTSSGTEKGDKKWAASGQRSYSDAWPHLYSSKEASKSDFDGAATSGYEGWQLVRKDNPTALYQNFPAIKYSLCYPDPMTLTDAQIDAKFTGGSVKDRWYLPSVDELKDIYKSLTDGSLPKEIADKVRGKQLWSVNTSKANYSYIVDFNDGNDYEKNRLDDYWLVPIAQFTYQ